MSIKVDEETAQQTLGRPEEGRQDATGQFMTIDYSQFVVPDIVSLFSKQYYLPINNFLRTILTIYLSNLDLHSFEEKFLIFIFQLCGIALLVDMLL